MLTLRNGHVIVSGLSIEGPTWVWPATPCRPTWVSSCWLLVWTVWPPLKWHLTSRRREYLEERVTIVEVGNTTLYTHSLLIHEEDTMVVSTSWRSSPFSCKPNTMLNWLNWWDLLLDIWEYTGTPPTGNWFFQRRRDPSKMSLTWYSWEKNALLQEVETVTVSSSWTSRECVYGLGIQTNIN